MLVSNHNYFSLQPLFPKMQKFFPKQQIAIKKVKKKKDCVNSPSQIKFYSLLLSIGWKILVTAGSFDSWQAFAISMASSQN